MAESLWLSWIGYLVYFVDPVLALALTIIVLPTLLLSYPGKFEKKSNLMKSFVQANRI